MDATASAARSAERVVETKRVEAQVLGGAGALLLGLAAIFSWQELHLATEVLMVAAAVGAAGLAWWLASIRAQLVGPVLLLGATGAGALWYGATREPVLLWALGVTFAASVAMALWDRVRPRVESALDKWHRLLSWHGVALSGLGASFALYFQVFDASDLSLSRFVARRALLTLAWLFAGVGLVLRGRAVKATELRDAGFLVLAAAVGKLLVYDTMHLDGGLRIGLLFVAGAVLVASAVVARRLNAGRS